MENDKKQKRVSANAQVKEEKKYTEAEFNAACSQLYQKLVKEIQARDMTNMFKRLDYLFEVLKNSNFFNEDFVQSCAEEIEVALTPVEPEETQGSTTED